MSAENRPNVNAVGVMIDSASAVEKHLRGPAALPQNKDMAQKIVLAIAVGFAEEVSEALDVAFGRG